MNRGVPASVEPPWRHLPSLAWVAAAPTCQLGLPGGVGAAAAACSLLLWLPCLACLRVGHSLAALDRHALVAIEAVRAAATPILAAATVAVVNLTVLSLVAALSAVAALSLGLGADVVDGGTRRGHRWSRA